LGGGGNIATLRNQNGVSIRLTSTTAGLSISMAWGDEDRSSRCARRLGYGAAWVIASG
jgi:hypothetical protein